MKDHEVTCVQKSDRTQIHEKIKLIGGIDPADGKRWTLSQGEAITLVQAGKLSLHVNAGGKAVPVVIGTSAWGQKYLKGAADREQPNTLLNLPDCPYF